MKCRSVLSIALATSALALAATAANAAELPPIKTTGQNKVPECATPGRMMAFIKARNTSLDPKFEKIAVHYMREGEALGVRWDYAIAQMAVETNYLSYKQGNGRQGLVNPRQNNFAGLGATGKGQPGESFADVETGVRAHLQHLLHYAGDTIENAAAERTRKIQEWGVLKSFHAKIKGPVTFKHLANKWAMDSNYAVSIETHAQRFYSDFCKGADPQPELVAEARGGTAKGHKVAAVAAQPERRAEPEKKIEKPAATASAEPVSGAELARRAIEDSKTEGNAQRQGLGVKPMTILNAQQPDAEGPPKAERAEAFDPPAEKEAQAAALPVAKAEKAVAGAGSKAETARKGAEKTEKSAQFVTASAGGVAAASAGKLQPSQAGKCRVFTASYGGHKTILIRAQASGMTNYTVLDVNEGQEKREVDAYIAAYAKGGEIAAEFPGQAQALDKAFELCPEG